MFNLDENRFSADSKPAQKIQTLIVGRLFVVFLLFAVKWIWNSGYTTFSFNSYPRGLFPVLLMTVGLTGIYFTASRFIYNYAWQIRIQIFFDAFSVTWLVWRSGDITSPFISLFIIIISLSSIFLSARDTVLMTLICVLFFTLLAILVVYGVVPTFVQTPEFTKTLQIVGSYNIALLLVGLLASRLSGRYASGEELKETLKSLADLRVLHERIIESIRSGLITTDLDGEIYSFNAAASEITGYQAEQMSGKSIFSLFGSIQTPIEYSLYSSDNGEQPPRFETDCMTPEGFAVRIGYHISPLFAKGGKKTGLIISFQDLTDIRSMEENVRRKDRLAAVGRVAAGLAHEIRNPLGAMRGAIQVLQLNTPPGSSQASLMEIILRESDRLNKIITNFLTYARPRVSNFSEIDVRQAINDTFALLLHSPDILDHHELKTDLPESPVLISADSTQLKQIFWNLARNALGAMPQGGKLKIGLQQIDENRIRILFEDTGCGMSPEQVEKLFEPFSDSTTGGTGLGLSIVYQIVRDHNGTINVRSRENTGTTITVELPTETKNQSLSGESEQDEDTFKPSRLEDFLIVKEREAEVIS